MKRLALIGYGGIARYHIAAFRALGVEIVAAANRQASNRENAHREGGIERTYSSVGDLLASETPDAVLNCATASSLCTTSRVVIESGLPLLMEKPPGATLAEFDQLEGLANDSPAPVMVGLNRRRYSILRKALAEVGGPEAIRAVYVDWSEDPEHLLRRGIPRDLIPGWNLFNSIHGLDLLCRLAGPVPHPQISVRVDEGFCRYNMLLQGESARGVVCSFRSTWDSPQGWRVTFCTRDRSYTLAPLETCTVQARDGEPRIIEPDRWDTEFKPGLYGQARLFREVVRYGKAHAGGPRSWGLPSARPAMELAQALTDALRARTEDPSD